MKGDSYTSNYVLFTACNLPRHNKQGYIVPDCVIFGVGEKYGNLIGGNAYKVPEQIAEEADA